MSALPPEAVKKADIGSRWKAEHSALPSAFKRRLVPLCVTEQKLHGSQIPSAPKDRCGAPLPQSGQEKGGHR